MGYKLAGCDVIGCCEIDKRMNEIYKKNHNPKYNYLMDIREFNQISNNELPKELFSLDILDGSPPCTTFSMSGLREKSWGKKKKFKEGQAEQTLDDLSFVFIDTVEKLKPKCVIMENVEGLLQGQAWDYVQRIYKGFAQINYQVKHYLLKGEYMGIPQTRHRVFFIAFRNDVNFDFDALDMIFDYEPIPYGKVKEGVGEPASTLATEMLNKAKHCDLCFRDIYVRLGERPHWFSAQIAWEENVLKTITAKCEQYRGTEKTKLSTIDVIHCQTFPEDYDFLSTAFSRIGYVCGMSVPPIMIKRIVTRIIETGVFENGK